MRYEIIPGILIKKKSTCISKALLKKYAVSFLFLIFFSFHSVFAQEEHDTYKTGIGIRGGNYPGLTIKHFISGNSALEGILHTHTRYRGFLFTGLYEIHAQAFNVARLHWFYGLGGHFGLYKERYYRDRFGYYCNDGRCDENLLVIGVDGILGLEYHITEIPFTIGLDIKPFFDILNPGYGYLDGALSIRYTF